MPKHHQKNAGASGASQRQLRVGELVRHAVADLAPLHKVPFDRIQVAQAREEGIVLLTADAQVAAYGAPVELV